MGNYKKYECCLSTKVFKRFANWENLNQNERKIGESRWTTWFYGKATFELGYVDHSLKLLFQGPKRCQQRKRWRRCGARSISGRLRRQWSSSTISWLTSASCSAKTLPGRACGRWSGPPKKYKMLSESWNNSKKTHRQYEPTTFLSESWDSFKLKDSSFYSITRLLVVHISKRTRHKFGFLFWP